MEHLEVHCPSQTWKPIFQPTLLEVFEYQDSNQCLQSVSIAPYSATYQALLTWGVEVIMGQLTWQKWFGCWQVYLVPWRWIELQMERACTWLTRDFIGAAGFPFPECQHIFSCTGKAFQSAGLYSEMVSQLINSTSGESVHPTLSQNQKEPVLRPCCWEMVTCFLSCANVPDLAEISYYLEIPETSRCM